MARTRTKPTDYPISLRVPRDLQRDLLVEAHKHRRPFSFVVIEILREWQERRRKK